MAVKEPKKIKNMSIETIMGRVDKMKDIRDQFLMDIDNIHVKLQQGNSKTGKNVFTVSLIPILDCSNCKECMKECYDIINVCFQPAVMNDRAKNSAIHKADPERFWNEVGYGIQYNAVTMLRINVGGDIKRIDLDYINDMAKRNPKCDILFFTKSYDDVNDFLKDHTFEPNVHCLFSAWKNTEMNNPYNLPVSHVLYYDGSTTAPEYGSYYCGGNCAVCHYNDEGCWNLNNGESVIFPAH